MNYPLPQPQQQYAPQYPQAPAQQYPQQVYPPAPPAYGQAPYPAYPPAAPPQAPLAQGSIDEFYSQPNSGSGPGISWKNKPIGTTYVGLVARDVQQGDIVQDVDFTTKQPKFRQGRPVFVMKVPLLVQPCPEFPEGEFTFWVRGQSREELVRAMAQAGLPDGAAPKAGALIQVTLVQRKPNNTGNPTNIVQIQYTPDHGQVPAAPAPVQQAAPQQFQQAPQQQFAPAPQQYAAPPAQQFQPVPQVQYAQAPAAPVQQAAPAAPAPAALVAQAPVAQTAPVPAPPAGLDPNAAAILQQLTGAPAPAGA